MHIEKSCGAVLFTEINGKRHYVLVSSTVENNCGLPKGHVENDETDEETALREISEETCVNAKIIEGFRKQIEYVIPNGKIKQVVFFIAQYQNQEAKNNPCEKFTVMLLPIDEALRSVTFENVRKVLLDADKWLANEKRQI